MFDRVSSSLRKIETKNLLGVKPRKETEHFRLFCTESDVKCLNDISKSLEDNYKKILDDLQFRLGKKVVVKIFPDIKTYHKLGLGKEDEPDWSVGTARHGELMIVSPLNAGPTHSFKSIIKVSVHEFTHIVIDKINKNVPTIINEGIAGYESDQMSEHYKARLKESINENKIPTLNQLEFNFDKVGGYWFSYTLVEFIIKEFGWKALNRLIRHPSQVEAILGMSKDEAWGKWVEYLKNNYA